MGYKCQNPTLAFILDKSSLQSYIFYDILHFQGMTTHFRIGRLPHVEMWVNRLYNLRTT